MKKLLLFTMFICCSMAMWAQDKKPAEIKFDESVHHFGEFSEKDAKQSCTFTFTNVGEEALVINQAVASCGCTIPKYPKEPIQPGEKGTIEVLYNGKGKSLGFFKKTITVRTNGAVELTRLVIDGTMTAATTE